jgi:hypothetical protein
MRSGVSANARTKPGRRNDRVERMQRAKLRFAADPLGVTSFGIREESRTRNED